MQQRKAMLLFVKGKGDQPRVTWPDPVRDLLKEAIDDKKKVKEEYKEILRMLFANSPLPLLFQVKSITPSPFYIVLFRLGPLGTEGVCLIDLLTDL